MGYVEFFPISFNPPKANILILAIFYLLSYFIKHYNNKIFFCYCRTDVAEEKMLERGDENPVALTRHKELTRLYDMVMGLISVNCPYNFRKYDFTKKRSINELLGQISYFVYMNGGLN